jgi:O-antigen/teichoic acid export membrane protein
LRFKELALASVVQSAVLSLVTVILAFIGLSYWSLVIGSLASSVALVAAMRYFENADFKPVIDAQLAKELLGFGKHLLVSGLMAFLIFNIDQLVIGKVLGIISLGFYFIAMRFGRTIGEQIATTVNRVLFPTMARIKEQISLIRTSYSQSIRMIAILVAPASLGLSAMSPVFVAVLLGDKWADAALPLSILSVQGLANSLIPTASNVLIALGKPRYLSVPYSFQAAAMLLGVYPAAVLFGIEGICVLTTALSLIMLVYYVLIVSVVFKDSFFSVALPMIPALVSSIVMSAVLLLVSLFLGKNLLSLAALVVLGSVTYVVLLHYASGGRDVRDFLRLLKIFTSNRVE